MQPSFKTLEQAFLIRDCCPLCHDVLKFEIESPINLNNLVKNYIYDDKIFIEDNEVSLQIDLKSNNFSIDEDSIIDHSLSYLGGHINGWLITPMLYCEKCEYDIKFQSLRFDLSLNKIHKIFLATESLDINQHLVVNGFIPDSSCRIYKLEGDYPLLCSLKVNYNFTNKTFLEINSWIKTVTTFS